MHSFPPGGAGLSICAAAEKLPWGLSLLRATQPGLGHLCRAALSLVKRCSPAQRSFQARAGGAETLGSAHGIPNHKALAVSERTHGSREEAKASSRSQLLELSESHPFFASIFHPHYIN